jgi:molecular chaperone DnaK (HSP70)
VDVKPSCGLTAELVEATIEASIDHTEDDYRAAQVALMRVEADGILAAVDKAKRNDAWLDLADEERRNIIAAINRLQSVYHAADHHLIRAEMDALNEATHGLAENMMNTAVRSALKGTKV